MRKNQKHRKNKRRISALDRLESAHSHWINLQPQDDESKELRKKKIKNLSLAITGTKNNLIH